MMFLRQGDGRQRSVGSDRPALLIQRSLGIGWMPVHIDDPRLIVSPVESAARLKELHLLAMRAYVSSIRHDRLGWRTSRRMRRLRIRA
jgi:hypothetical protein